MEPELSGCVSDICCVSYNQSTLPTSLKHSYLPPSSITMLFTTQILLAALALIATATSLNCPCYTETRTISPSNCPPLSGPCIRPLCIRLVTSTIPGHNPHCPNTRTVQVHKPCPTKCETGCGTSVTTVTAPVACPMPTSTGCYTYTTGPRQPYLCPDVAATCIRPMCLVQKTLTVPAEGPACPSTPTVTVTPSCIPTCVGACGTVIVTVKAEPTES
ncbi:hypothetical protein EJ06DRAFT_585070 [Trichodelitschia bisporula]|uniref:Uncharacterized protein n=1 Tax=Trichodelitschia bisporula TaxID=703511 RepID=A0A6G1HL48_9PEZI|nr:hypothetical protein EJ06DRAFT_585070 [Trichodelitschia bisporula]